MDGPEDTVLSEINQPQNDEYHDSARVSCKSDGSQNYKADR